MDKHIGQMVKGRMLQLRMSPSAFAKALGKHPKHIHHLFKRKEYHCKLLRQVSEILQYDFFSLYTNVNFSEMGALKKKVEELEKENALLKRENTLLVQANNWLSKGK